jgi:hypothetical protein
MAEETKKPGVNYGGGGGLRRKKSVAQRLVAGKDSLKIRMKESLPAIKMEVSADDLQDFMHDSDDEGEVISYDENGNMIFNQEAFEKHQALHGHKRKKKRGKFGGGVVDDDEDNHEQLASGGTMDWDKDGDGKLDWDELDDYAKSGMTWNAKMCIGFSSIIFCCGGSYAGVAIIGNDNMGGRGLVAWLSIVGSILGCCVGYNLMRTFCAISCGIKHPEMDWSNTAPQLQSTSKLQTPARDKSAVGNSKQAWGNAEADGVTLKSDRPSNDSMPPPEETAVEMVGDDLGGVEVVAMNPDDYPDLEEDEVPDGFV